MEKDNSKLTPQQEAYTILRAAGKSVREAYELAGYEGKPETKAHHALERKIRPYTLVEPDLLKRGHSIAKLTLKLAETVLKDDGKEKLTTREEIALKKAYEIYLEQQKREAPVITRNINLNVGASNMHDLIDLSAYRDPGGEDSIEPVISADFTEEKPQ